MELNNMRPSWPEIFDLGLDHLWLTITNMPDRVRASYLDKPISPKCLFGQSLKAMQASFDLWKKQAEALQSVPPRCDAKAKPKGFSVQLPRSNPLTREPPLLPQWPSLWTEPHASRLGLDLPQPDSQRVTTRKKLNSS